MSPAETIIGIYRGFQTTIGCGTTTLYLDDETWVIVWTSPFPREGRGERYAARYSFNQCRLSEGAPGGYLPEVWGQILACEVREKWGGNPNTATAESRPLVMVDGMDA